MKKDTFRNLREYFTVDKVKKDLFLYLDQFSKYYDKEGESYRIDLVYGYYDETLTGESILVSENDKFDVFSIRTMDLVIYEEFLYHVVVIIGNYERTSKNVPLSGQKCFLTIKYDSDYSVFDICFHEGEI